MDERARLTHTHHTLRLALRLSRHHHSHQLLQSQLHRQRQRCNIISPARHGRRKQKERTKKEKEIRNMTNLTNHPKTTTQLSLRERPSKSLVSSRCSVGTYSHLHPSGDETRLLMYLLVDCSSSQAKTCHCCLRVGDQASGIPDISTAATITLNEEISLLARFCELLHDG